MHLVQIPSEQQHRALRAVMATIAGDSSALAASTGADGLSNSQILALLDRHRVGGLWFAALRRGDGNNAAQLARFGEMLGERQRGEAARALQQDAMALKAGQVLQGVGVCHAFFKAVHLRRWLYTASSLRPATDVDVMVQPHDRVRARLALIQAGFELASTKEATHEETYFWREGYLDLHWSPFRPGRTRRDVASLVLRNRRELRGLWVLSVHDELLLLLLSTALADYVSARLIRAVDIDGIIRRASVDWGAVVSAAREFGLATAAWCTLRWVHDWMQTPVPEQVWKALEPSHLRRAYLERWLSADPWQTYALHPLFAQVAFSLALHDKWSDALVAVATESGRRVRGHWHGRGLRRIDPSP